MISVKEFADKVQQETEKIIVGKSDVIRLVIMSVLANGHVLLDDLPGIGKTTLVKTLSIALGCENRRIQFVPDLLPSDIIGMHIFNQKIGDFELRMGPVMTNILLADEINRAIPRTQSALLEAMEERQVSIDGERMALPEPFIVLATQNPVESESTFRLPAAQMDRFLVKLSMGYPELSEEKRMLSLLGDEIPFDSVKSAADPDSVCAAQKSCESVHVSDELASYIVALADASRNNSQLVCGISPRGSRSMYKAVKVWAAMQGRDYATPDDVKCLAHPVWEHRLVLKNSAGFSGVTASAVLDKILETTNASPDVSVLKDAE